MCGQQLMQKYWLPWLVGMPMETSFAICSLLFSGLFDKLPSLRVCFAHGGGAFPGTIGRIQHGFEARPDLCAVDTKRSPRSYCGTSFWLDSLVHDEEALRTVVKLVGAEKVCLGSDYPFPLGELRPGELIESMGEWSEEQKKQMLWKSGLKFLGLEEKEEFFLSQEEEEGVAQKEKEKEKQEKSGASMNEKQEAASEDGSASLDRLSLEDTPSN